MSQFFEKLPDGTLWVIFILTGAGLYLAFEYRDGFRKWLQSDAIAKMQGRKLCPFCAETLKAEAKKCKHCLSDLV